jgi:hypothetical protein
MSLDIPMAFWRRSPNLSVVPCKTNVSVRQAKEVNFKTREGGSWLNNALQMYSPNTREFPADQAEVSS